MSVRILSGSLKLLNFQNSNLLYSNTSRSARCGCHQERYFSAKSTTSIVRTIDPITGEEKRKKTLSIPKITLLSGNNVSVTTLEQAQNLSKRRDLKLVKIVDLNTKTQRPVYKLMSGSEYHEEDLKQREQRKKDKLNSNTLKGEKVLMMSSNISEHDLQTYCKKIVRWAKKNYEVRVVINGVADNPEKAEKVYNYLEIALKDEGPRLLQKRQKGSDIKFQILPPKKNKNPDRNDSSVTGSNL